MVQYEARARLVYTQAMTGAVLFQFSRHPQFLTVGYEVAVGSDILFIYKQLFFMNCTAKLLKKLKIAGTSNLYFHVFNKASPFICLLYKMLDKNIVEV